MKKSVIEAKLVSLEASHKELVDIVKRNMGLLNKLAASAGYQLEMHDAFSWRKLSK